MKPGISLLLIFLGLISEISSFIIGIDFGSEFYKPGTPFSIVENIQSHRKTPTSIFIKDEERVYGLDAVNKKIRNPQSTFVYPHEFLGRKFGDLETKSNIEKYFTFYDMSEDQERQTFEFKVKYYNKDLQLSPEEVTGQLFRYIKYLSDKFSKSDIKDCVITVPVFFNYKQRLAIHQSAEIAGLNVLGIVNENLGAAVSYGLEKKFNKTENVIFYNMGSSFTQVSLVSFKTTEELNKATNKTNDFNTITVLSEAWDNHLGGRDFNYKLVRHLMSLFDAMPARKGKPSVSTNYKIAEKMLPAAVKAKEVLSANKDAFVQVLGVEDGLNLMERIPRETFEKICENELERVYFPIEKVLNTTNLTLDDISQVELIGGSIRVPAVQERLREKIGQNKLGMHMNGDESVAFGTAFLAANLSSNFRTKRVDIIHGLSFEIRIKLNHYLNENDTLCGENVEDLALNCTRKLNKETTLYKLRHGFDLARTVSFKHDSDFDVEVYEKFEDSEENRVLTFRISGVKKVLGEAIAKGHTPANHKVHLRFRLDKNGFIELRPEVTYDNTVYFAEIVGPTGEPEFSFIPNKTLPLTQDQLNEVYNELLVKMTNQSASSENNQTVNTTENTNNTTNSSDPANNTFTASNNFTIPNVNETYVFRNKKRIGETKTNEIRKEVSTEKNFSFPLPMTRRRIRQAIEKLDEMDRNDELRLKTMERRNFLEAFIYDKREWLEGNSESKQYMSVEEVGNAYQALIDTKEWFEEDGFMANLTVIEEKIKNLTSFFTASILRMDKFKRLYSSFEKFERELNESLVNATNLVKYKPWINESFHANFSKLHMETSAWFFEAITRQKQQNYTQEPVTTPETLELKIKALRLQIRDLNRIPMPKIERPVVNETVSDNTTNAGNTTETNTTYNNSNETLNDTANNTEKREDL